MKIAKEDYNAAERRRFFYTCIFLVILLLVIMFNTTYHSDTSVESYIQYCRENGFNYLICDELGGSMERNKRYSF